jgi:ABC-type oligopeptide transport system substrate-binding subunit
MPPPQPWQAPPPPAFGPPPGPYDQQPGPYNQPQYPPYGQQPPAGQQFPPPGYGPQQDAPPPGYGPQPPYGQQPAWGQQPGYGAPGYPPPYGPGGPYGPVPPKSRKGLVIGLVAGGVVVLVLLVLGVVGLASLAGGGKPTPSASGSGKPGRIINGGSLTTTLNTDLSEGILPADAADADAYSLVEALWTGLVRYDPKSGKLVDAIADSVTTSDAKTWTIKLKQGWTFDNGEAVDADSFIRSWSYAATSSNAAYASYQFSRIAGYAALQAKPPKATTLSGLSAPDRYTLKVTLTAPFSWFEYQLAEAAFMPMAKACADSIAACQTKPIGNGPFKMDSAWAKGGEVRLARNNGYHGTKAHLDNLVFQAVLDSQKGMVGFQGGAYDVVPTVTGSALGQAKAATPRQVVSRPGLAVYYLGFPTYVKAFSDKRVRQAFSEALDRQQLATAVGSGLPLASFAPAGLPGAPAADSCTHCKSNVEEAKSLLAAAKFPTNQPIQLYVSSTSSTILPLMEAIQQQLKTNLGVQATINTSMTGSAYYDAAQKHKLTGPFRLPWVADFPTAEEYLSQQFFSKGAYNYFGYQNAAVDKAIGAGDGAATPDAAATAYQPAWQQLDDDLPATPLYQGQQAALVSSKVGGVALDPVGTIDFAAAGRLG